MDYLRWQAGVVVRFDALVKNRGSAVGGKIGIRKQFGLPEGFFTELRRQKAKMPLHRLFPIIEFLGERPAVLLYRAALDMDRSLPNLEEPKLTVEDLPEGHIAHQAILEERTK